jgi:hypothetical protein
MIHPLIQLIKHIREEGLLIPSDNTEILVRRLALALEGGEHVINASSGDPFDGWLSEQHDAGRLKALGRHKAELVDELYILLDQIRSDKEKRRVP